eukprot:CAMPEP_0204853872 /NCGR_PEP_ID=MMETSP1347-20130617/14202_1 /ASSEMBLY_ACC=CAM_ASM_000690 /TAXON_ID=215587 /ORGANISM="Aplanochytrium stocchinoi, Strain GSBS06" /LENGTH=89 /DNA_ID=CAMNT_0051999091 /DNA_START=241 /DNA_END=507 /DNA_ORIENTATION=-
MAVGRKNSSAIWNESSGVDPLPKDADPKEWFARRGWPMGQVAGSIDSIESAKDIIDDMVKVAVHQLSQASTMIDMQTKSETSTMVSLPS